MNLYDCDGTHDCFRIRQAADFERYFCLVIGAYMSGNNSGRACLRHAEHDGRALRHLRPAL